MFFSVQKELFDILPGLAIGMVCWVKWEESGPMKSSSISLS